MKRQLFALLGVIALVGAAVGPAMAAAGSTSASAANAPLDIGVTQDDGVTVTVTANGSGVDNASVDVATVEDNATYAGTGTYTTGPNGTVGLPAPNESVAVSITATDGNRTAETTTTLIAAVDENATFGQQVSSLVHALQASTEGGIGGAVSNWVTANNPGNAPDHAGGPGGANATNATANDSERGPPAFVQAFLDAADRMDGESEDDQRGPPAHAGGPDAHDDENETEDESEDEIETDDDRQGPPADAGPDGDRGNGNGPANAGPSDDGDDEDEAATEEDADDESAETDA